MRVHYTVDFERPHAHLIGARLRITQPAKQQRLMLPVWIAGSYLVREFSQHLQGIRAQQGRKACEIKQKSKHEWVIKTDGETPLTVTYDVYALDASVRTAYFDQTRAFFNPTSVCLQVLGQADVPHRLTVIKPTDRAQRLWRTSTALPAKAIDTRGFGTYEADCYDTLADSPFTISDFWRSQFKAHGVTHELVVTGIGNSQQAGFDVAKLVADTQRICETEIRFWHGEQPRGQVPFDRYVFMLHASHDGYGGLEHRFSTALICQRSDLPTADPKAAEPSEGYRQLLGLISHEYFHTWNVKRLRPQELATIDFTRENYTELLWFFEGFTSYYDDLFLQRAGLIKSQSYLDLVAKTINQVAATPGRHIQSVAQASFDAWVKYYRINENTPNATVSYYTKGALVALCTDLALRAHGSDLDTLMRDLWTRAGGGPMTEAMVYESLTTRGFENVAAQLRHWVHSTEDLPIARLLEAVGVRVTPKPAPLPQRLGMRVNESSGVRIAHVARGAVGEDAGFAAGDEWLAAGYGDDMWRVKTLSDVERVAKWQTQQPDEALTVWFSRDGRMMKSTLRWPQADARATAQLVITDHAKLATWLKP